ncbi:MAG: lysophospholipid acyltransferase family protein [Pseudomonadota bacterium]
MTVWLVAALLLVGFVALCHRAHRADWGHFGLNLIDGCNRLFCRFFHGLRTEPVRLPEHGPALVVANHVSGLDPLLMIAACDRPLRFIIAREEYQRPVLNRLFRAIGCIPVERGRSPHSALRAARRALERGEVVALFPQGRLLTAAERRGEQRPPMKPGLAWLAAASGAPIQALRLDGIRGAGLTVAAVTIPSRARVRACPPIRCAARHDRDSGGEPEPPLDTEGCLAAVRHCIENGTGPVANG